MLSYRPARLHRLAGRYDNPLPKWTLSPSQGLRIWLQDFSKGIITSHKRFLKKNTVKNFGKHFFSKGPYSFRIRKHIQYCTVLYTYVYSIKRPVIRPEGRKRVLKIRVTGCMTVGHLFTNVSILTSPPPPPKVSKYNQREEDSLENWPGQSSTLPD
jgi:hypothetical protein